MMIPAWMSSGIHPSSSVKRNLLLIPTLFLVNSYIFSSASRELFNVTVRPGVLWIMLYGLVGVLPLVWRDKAPVPVFAVLWAHTVAGWPILPQYTPVLSLAVALYAVSLHCGIKTSLLALLVVFVPAALDTITPLQADPDLPGMINIVITNAVIILALFIGAWIQGRLAHAIQENIKQHIKRLEHERKTAREAVVAERRRIARELHDIVSHAVTVIVLQAAGAARVADTDLAQVKQSLTHVETTGKQTMTELRRLLGVLEDGDPASHAVGTGELGPQPGLADVPALLSSLRDTGMTVSLDVEGVPHDLDPSVDLAAYRIVQEGLTNVLKHAGKDADPRLRLSWEPQILFIQIDNDTSSMGAHPGRVLSVGRGLVGLRERAQAVGGGLHAGPHRHGYRLAATLPLAATAGGVVVPTVPGGSSEDQGRLST